ncbi:hypothetical protein [Actibacterium lipolyticum]|uniref:Uncharacterized protein n=1 Tax=Actibacterium lipolyticum TaxID=1524263 RepID=A0A238KTM6_9RHOB|nr:hypothetical protein [Actibacterium lipolyticum]SMX46155.1 hypothetical protein COL8621_02989 [Actibacterium lipolyticum]
MRILNARVKKARYARDFGMVEAIVTLLVKDTLRPVPYEMDVMAFAPRDMHRKPGALRSYLIEHAKKLNERSSEITKNRFAAPAA